jgi:hypothetical protein
VLIRRRQAAHQRAAATAAASAADAAAGSADREEVLMHFKARDNSVALFRPGFFK